MVLSGDHDSSEALSVHRLRDMKFDRPDYMIDVSSNSGPGRSGTRDRETLHQTSVLTNSLSPRLYQERLVSQRELYIYFYTYSQSAADYLDLYDTSGHWHKIMDTGALEDALQNLIIKYATTIVTRLILS